MQELILMNEEQVVVQVVGKIYQESVRNFLTDYGKSVDYTTIDYNRETKGCWLNGKAFQPYPNKVCEDILNSIDTLLAKKAEREYVGPTFEELKTTKLAEIKNCYVEAVYAPVWFEQTMVDPVGGEATTRYVGYDTDQNSQIDFNSSYKRAQLKGSTLYNIYVNPDDLTEKEFTYHTPEMFDAALLAAGDYQEGVYIKYYGLKAKVEAAETAEELEAIVW